VPKSIVGLGRWCFFFDLLSVPFCVTTHQTLMAASPLSYLTGSSCSILFPAPRSLSANPFPSGQRLKIGSKLSGRMCGQLMTHACERKNKKMNNKAYLSDRRRHRMHGGHQ
jgi:hypothetical protein